MANYLSPKLQNTFFSSQAFPGSGCFLFLYASGTTTKQTAYQDSTTTTAWANPITLDSNGNLPSGSKEVWFVGGQTYKAVYAPSNDTDPPVSPILTLDNLSGINDPSGISTNTEWIESTGATFVSATSFTVTGDQTSTYTKGRRIKAIVSGNTVYGTILSSAFSTVTTVVITGATLVNPITTLYYGLFDPANPSISALEVQRQSSSTLPAAGTTNVWGVDGDSVHITGSTSILSFSTAPYAGAIKKLFFDSTPPIVTSSSALVIPPYGGTTTFTMAASSVAMVYADTTSKMLLLPFASGKQSRTVLTTSSGTYTTPSGVARINVRLVGGGGGGGGRDANIGATGTTTTFGSLSAAGGVGGNPNGGNGGAGGTGSGGDLNLQGGGGGGGAINAAAGDATSGGKGGDSAFGGGAVGVVNAAGGSGATNTGGGGGGGGGTGSVNSGAGGGAGAYVEKLFNPPSGTYAYVVGPGGTGGAAGGQQGGAGGSGIIIIDEYFF